MLSSGALLGLATPVYDDGILLKPYCADKNHIFQPYSFSFFQEHWLLKVNIHECLQ